jgi:hypothetical protein
MDVGVKINTNQLMRAYHLVPKELEYELKDAFDHLSRKFLKVFRNKRLSGPPGVKARPRGLFTHFKRNVVFRGLRGTDSYAEIYTESKIAKLHEEGGTLRDPSGGKIAVPLSARTQMFTSSGALRKRYKNIAGLRNIIPKIINGKVFLVRVKKRDKSILPLYVLKKSVRVKPRLEFYETFHATAPVMYGILNKAFDKALQKGWGRA